MDEKTTYWASIALGAVALVLLVINMSLINGNRHLQEEISQRQAAINSGVTLNQVNKGLVQALAEIAVKNSDTEARGLLAAQGITIAPAGKTEEGKESKKKSSDPSSDQQPQ
ncbi:MAG: hypothetical protein M3N08_02585 [Pseudomonadota bacterium]|nr:hypothetical protein [Pseudomonadota bacterium]